MNGIVHPAVRWLMVKAVLWEWLVRGRKVVVLDIPLLFESGLDQFCGINVVVATREEIQLQRLLKRDPHLSEVDARGRVGSQWRIDEKRKLADVIIENDSTREDLERRVGEVVEQYFRRSRVWTWVLRFPPVGFLFALLIFIRRRLTRKVREKTS